ncbi:TPA: restriction endonuclease subunit S [Vibrio vulnificus]|uniref:restriction endonuclease subunit S n=1 Tax=Vibrio vulnificus TaxID=672 RepID=UPI0005761009|nr:restriction endonuclease subunit S [Vibrio vulnificus]HAS6938033.1 restriction endonuclease subunit S [Vibrio vulnificus]
MSSNWPTVKLGDFCKKIGSGATPRGGASVYMDDGEICLIRSQNVHNEGFNPNGLVYIDEDAAKKLSNVIVEENDVLLNITGDSVARVCLAKSRFLPARVNQHVAIIRPDEDEFDPRFIRYLLASPTYQNILLSIAAVGATRNALTKGMIENLDVLKPPIEQQIEMANQLEALDKKIDINSETNQTLEQIAQAIFKSWFVDFDPVKAKIETLASGGSADDAELAAMRVISAKTVDELNSLKASNPEAFNKLAQTAALFPAAMQDSELGEIPEGWSVKQLGDHLNVLQTGSRPKGGVGGITEGVPSVGAENILGVGNYTYGKEKFVSREFFDKLKRGVVEDFDFLLYKDGGKPGEFKPRVSMFGCGFPYSEFAINEHVFRMRSESLGQAFLYFQIGHKRVLDELANRGGKAAIPGINQTDVKTIPVLVPGAADLLTEFNEFAQKIIESILKKSNESNHLVAVRDALLPKLLSGEIDLNSEVVE